MRRFLGLLALAGVLLAGCQSDPTAPRIEDTVFHPDLEVDLNASQRTITGLYFRDRVVGTGAEAVPGSTANLYYQLYLVNGTEVQAIRQGENDPFPYRVALDDVIEGFEEGVTGMRVGGQRQLIIPPNLGYGERPRQGLPGNSILIYEIQLESVE